MKTSDINIRDPFVLCKDGVYYLYGTRAKDFGYGVGGFDVYRSEDLVHFSEPVCCFDSRAAGLNRGVNWAPEVHQYGGSYVMLATFTQENGLRGTYALKADSPLGPFVPYSDGALTPSEWECLDGTLYVDGDGTPYLVFCHEHTQIIDGSICYLKLSDDLSHAVNAPVTLFHGSEPVWADRKADGEHYITDGPFLYTSKNGTLLMIWSTFIKGKYAQCLARANDGGLTAGFTHLPPLLDDDGGHGMIFEKDGVLMLTLHTPNKTGEERPCFRPLYDSGDTITLQR